ncbi:hypothetical protein LV716_05560 [Flagellimonas sp. HMM57]|uniref:hypothetical protein n=1 Tax=unclassified Flagellimonas TaxID=2644544 RepID=UPI0013CF7F93|nr:MULTISPECIES: hypothetical protein [unclassified Flagellimonas]UII77239.1 hypothetical protein LV716_05560 [Flagellimonas sp. HMM57]
MKNYSVFLKISTVLWIVWGLVHIFAGVMTDYFILTGDIAGAVGGIADAIEPSTLQVNYPDAAGAVIGQHGFNLLWIGLTTLICSFFIWKGNKNAIFLAALTGGLADLGYFLFMDLGGYVNFMLGTVMTLVSSAAIILSFTAYFKTKNQETVA